MAKKAVRRGEALATRKQKPRSKPLTVAFVFRDIVRRLEAAEVVFAHGAIDADAEAAFIIGDVLRRHPNDISVSDRVTRPQAKRIRALVGARIKTRKPAAYLINKIYMRDVQFYIDERAIVPRSYLGELLDDHFTGPFAWLDSKRVTRVLDLCTGSGCLAILAALRFPNAHIDAVDLSADALEVARRNVADHKLADRITLYQGDLFAPLPEGRYDLIIANPPYVDAEGMANLPPECLYEPQIAFDGGPDGIAIVRRIMDTVLRWLKPGGGLLVEVGRCKPALERAYPRTPFLWLDTEKSEGEVFWLQAAKAT